MEDWRSNRVFLKKKEHLINRAGRVKREENRRVDHPGEDVAEHFPLHVQPPGSPVKPDLSDKDESRKEFLKPSPVVSIEGLAVGWMHAKSPYKTLVHAKRGRGRL